MAYYFNVTSCRKHFGICQNPYFLLNSKRLALFVVPIYCLNDTLHLLKLTHQLNTLKCNAQIEFLLVILYFGAFPMHLIEFKIRQELTFVVVYSRWVPPWYFLGWYVVVHWQNCKRYSEKWTTFRKLPLRDLLSMNFYIKILLRVGHQILDGKWLAKQNQADKKKQPQRHIQFDELFYFIFCFYLTIHFCNMNCIEFECWKKKHPFADLILKYNWLRVLN